LVPEAVFCESCGNRIAGGAATPPPRANEPPPLAKEPSPCAKEPTPAAAAVVRDHAVSSAPFKLSVALPQAMQVDRLSNVIVRFRACDDIYESVEFQLRCGTETISRMECCEGRPLAVEHQVTLAVTPKTCGDARLSLDIVCRIGQSGATETHTAPLQMQVDARAASTFNPVFNISQNQTSDRAGDTKGGDINVNLGGMQIAQHEDRSRYETSTSGFVPLAVQLKASPARLTLKAADEVLQLVSDDLISFGRNRENLIPLRICGSDGMVDVDANKNNLSRFHFRVERAANDCILRDGNGSEPSSYGTRVDGKPVPPQGCVCLASDRDVSVSAGREGVALEMRVRFYRDSWGRAAGFVLDRQDGARQRVCVVWRDVPLDGDKRVFWNGSRWMLSVGDAPSVPLVIGTSVSIGGKPFVVLSFRQTHVR
jgi:hypothetical protein